MDCRGEVPLLHLLKFGSASGEIRSGGALAWHCHVNWSLNSISKVGIDDRDKGC